MIRPLDESVRDIMKPAPAPPTYLSSSYQRVRIRIKQRTESIFRSHSIKLPWADDRLQGIDSPKMLKRSESHATVN